MLRSFSKLIFDQPVLYQHLRTTVLGGLPTPPLLRLLDARETDTILDVGCGNGFLAQEIRYRRYIGLDNDPRILEVAKARQLNNAEFHLADANEFPIDQTPVDKAILYGFLHHLDDMSAIAFLKQLGRSVKSYAVTLDPVYSRFHVVSNILCRLDRGGYVRGEHQIEALVAAAGWRIETKLIHYANTKIAKYISFRLLPPS